MTVAVLCISSGDVFAEKIKSGYIEKLNACEAKCEGAKYRGSCEKICMKEKKL